MFTGDKPREIRKGQRLSAEYLNSLRSAVGQVIVGGKGINVTRTGNRLVIERKRDQIIPRLRRRTGNVWKLSKELGLQWVYDGWEDISSSTPHMVTCGDIAVTDSRVAVLRKDNINASSIYTLRDITRISAGSGTLIDSGFINAGTNFGRGRLFMLNAGNDVLHDNVQGIWYWTSPTTLAWHYPSIAAAFHGIGYDGNYIYTTKAGSTRSTFIKLDPSGGTELAATLMADGHQVDRILIEGSDFYLAGYSSIPATCHKCNGTGGIVWSYNAGTVSSSSNYRRDSTHLGCTDVTLFSGDTYWTGIRNDDWTGSSGVGDNASLWKLDSAGALVWAWDSGGDLFGCCSDGEYLYVCGERNNASGTYATIWKLDFDGNVIASYDTGRDNFNDTEVGFAYVIRCNSTHLYVGTRAVVNA